MKAVVCRASDRPLAVEEMPCPAPGPGEVLIRIRRCGICGSELHLPEGPPRTFADGMVMGHEYAGEIVKLGAGVTGLAVGDLVAVYPALGCGQCAACHRGNEILCGKARRLLGGYAEHASIPAACAVRLPERLTAADGALVEPLAVAWYGVQAAAVQGGERVLVLGGGAIALGAIFWARRAGAGRIVAMSRSDRRAAMARDMGADAFVVYADDDLDRVHDALGGAPDVVFECAGAAGLLGKAVAHAATFGRIVSLGFGNRPDPVIPAAAGIKDLTIRFPVGYTRADFRHVAETMLDGHVDPKHLISRVVSLQQAPAMFAELLGRHSETKVQIAP